MDRVVLVLLLSVGSAFGSACHCSLPFTPLDLRLPCIWRGAIDSKVAKAAAKALRKHLSANPETELRGGSGADVASWDGGGGEQRQQGSMLEKMRKGDKGSFVAFDSSIAATSAVKAVRGVAKFPTALHTLHELHTANDGWPVVSIGGQGSGLPPHVHGASSLLLLQGHKTWAFWSPEAGLPEEARHVLPPPLLRTNSTATITVLSRLTGVSRPRICQQRPGDVTVLPAGAYHATLNTVSTKTGAKSKPTIGIGAQAAWALEARLDFAGALLDRSSGKQLAAHAVAGLGLASSLVDNGGAMAREAPDMAKLAIHHLRTVLEVEATDARAAVALGDLFLAVDQVENAVEVIEAAGDALLTIVEEAGGEESLEPSVRVSLGSAFRRLGGWHLRRKSSANNPKQQAQKLLRQAFFLDPEPMRKAAAERQAAKAPDEQREEL
jgi:hypothetical protein